MDKPVDNSIAGKDHASDMVQSLPKRKSRGNQYTKRREQKTARDNAERWQENPRYTVAALMRKLEMVSDGIITRSPVQIKALELMLDRVAPRLSAVEQTHVEPAARLTEAEIRAQLSELVANHGGLLQELIAEHARASIQARTAPADAQSDSTDSTQPIELIGQTHG